MWPFASQSAQRTVKSFAYLSIRPPWSAVVPHRGAPRRSEMGRSEADGERRAAGGLPRPPPEDAGGGSEDDGGAGGDVGVPRGGPRFVPQVVVARRARP